MWLVFDEDIGAALGKACEGDLDSDAVVLARAAQIVRQQMFEDTKIFNGSFSENCQQDSVGVRRAEHQGSNSGIFNTSCTNYCTAYEIQ
jgi:hypothetical protein